MFVCLFSPKIGKKGHGEGIKRKERLVDLLCLDVLIVNFVKQLWSPSKNTKSYTDRGR